MKLAKNGYYILCSQCFFPLSPLFPQLTPTNTKQRQHIRTTHLALPTFPPYPSFHFSTHFLRKRMNPRLASLHSFTNIHKTLFAFSPRSPPLPLASPYTLWHILLPQTQTLLPPPTLHQACNLPCNNKLHLNLKIASSGS